MPDPVREGGEQRVTLWRQDDLGWSEVETSARALRATGVEVVEFVPAHLLSDALKERDALRVAASALAAALEWAKDAEEFSGDPIVPHQALAHYHDVLASSRPPKEKKA